MTSPKTTKMLDLEIERVDSDVVQVEQDGGIGEDADRICLHRVQVRLLAEMFDLIAACDPVPHRTIARLQRQMVLLRNRIHHLDDWLATCSDHREDLTHEVMLVEALKDLVSEFTADFSSMSASEADIERTGNAPSVTPPLPPASHVTDTGRTRPAANQLDLLRDAA